jgi:hypothetical protein
MAIIPTHRLVERRRRRKTAAFLEFRALVAERIPEHVRRPVMEAIVKAVRENRPDALAVLPSPWRERLLAVWRPEPECAPAPVVPLFPRKGLIG